MSDNTPNTERIGQVDRQETQTRTPPNPANAVRQPSISEQVEAQAEAFGRLAVATLAAQQQSQLAKIQVITGQANHPPVESE
jgi:hypothetical protein